MPTMIATYVTVAVIALQGMSQAGQSAKLTYEELVEPVDYYATAEPKLRARLEEERDIPAYLALAEFHHQRGDWEEGLEVVEEAITLAPGDRRLRALRVEMVMLRMNDAGLFGMIGAGKALRRACEDDLEHDPDNGDAVLCLARYYDEAPGIFGGSSSKSEAYTERLREVGGAPWHLLQAELAEDDPDARIAAFRRAVSIRPEPGVFLNLVYALIEAEDLTGAFDCVARALELFPEERMLLYQFGRLAAMTRSRLGAGEQALLRFLSGPAAFGGREFRASGHWRLGMIYEAMGQPESARKAYTRALEIAPDNDRFGDALAALEETGAD